MPKVSRRQWITLAIIVVLMAMPIAWRAAQEAHRRARALNDLKGLGLLLALYAQDHDGRLPANLDELIPRYYPNDSVLTDVESGKRFVYLGAGKKWLGNPDDVLAYSPTPHNSGRNVLFKDGRGQWAHDSQLTNVQRER